MANDVFVCLCVLVGEKKGRDGEVVPTYLCALIHMGQNHCHVTDWYTTTTTTTTSSPKPKPTTASTTFVIE